MSASATPPDRSTLAAFIGAVLIGGTNFVAVRFSNETLDPFFGAALRFGGAAALLYVIAGTRRIPLPSGRALLGASLYGFLGFGVAYASLYYALVGLPAGTASVFLAVVPLLTLIVAVLHRQERFTARGAIGGVLAIAGIVLLSAGSLSGDLEPVYLVASFVGSLAIAESSVVVKGFPRWDPITTNAVGMTAGTAFLIVISLLAGERWELPGEAATWLVTAWLVVAGSVGLFVLFLYVIGRWTASASVYALTLMPVVAVTLGALLLDEAVTLYVVAGGAIVLAAVYIGALSQPAAPATPEVPPLEPQPPRR
ncbi:MAG: DMT family transporter [Actinomycetota bacterium]